MYLLFIVGSSNLKTLEYVQLF